MLLNHLIPLAEHFTNQPINFKYYSAETALLALQNDTLQFSHPSTFNDPFDSNINLFDFEEQYVRSYAHYVNKKFNGSNYSERFRLSRNFESRIIPNYKEYMRSIFENEDSDRGITCFSKRFDQILMWAHYANNHKGICLGYNLMLLGDLIRRQNSESTYLLVNYTDVIAPKKDFGSIDMVPFWFGTKHQSWAYEEEIRLISRPFKFNEQKKCLFSISKQVIRELYLGYNMNATHKEAVLRLIRSKYDHVTLYEIKPDYNTFTLTRHQISY